MKVHFFLNCTLHTRTISNIRKRSNASFHRSYKLNQKTKPIENRSKRKFVAELRHFNKVIRFQMANVWFENPSSVCDGRSRTSVNQIEIRSLSLQALNMGHAATWYYLCLCILFSKLVWRFKFNHSRGLPVQRRQMKEKSNFLPRGWGAPGPHVDLKGLEMKVSGLREKTW